LNRAVVLDMFTGNFWPLERKSSDYLESRESLVKPVMQSYQEVKQHQIMYGKKTPVLKEHNLNWDKRKLTETTKMTGSKYGKWLKEEYLHKHI